MLHSYWSLLNQKFSHCAASEPAAALTRSSVNFCLMKNGCVLEAGCFAVIASSVIVLFLYNSLNQPRLSWEIRTTLPRTPMYPSSLFDSSGGLSVTELLSKQAAPPMGGGVLSSLFSWLITALHHHPRPALPLSLWLCCKLSVRWPAPSVFHGAGPETMGQNNPTPSICDETGCCHGSMNEIEWGNLAFCFLEKYGGR